MYVGSITLENIRTFASERTVMFNHPDRDYRKSKEIGKEPRFKNVNIRYPTSEADLNTTSP